MEDDNMYYEYSDSSIREKLGLFIREQRQSQNKTQQQLAEAAGINRSTLIKMEDGAGGTLASFIQLLRALGRLDVFRQFEVSRQVSPLLLAKEQKARYRVRKPSSGNTTQPESDW